MAQIELNEEIIEDVIPLYPELMATNFKELVVEQYNNILEIKTLLHDAREKVRFLEKLLKENEENFSNISPLFNLVFKTKLVNVIEADSDMIAMHRKGKIY